MPLPLLKHPGYTLEDWKTWAGRWELIDGVAHDMTPSPSLEHYRVSHGLERAIDAALDEARRKTGGGTCDLFHAPVDLYLDSGVFIPDLMIVCDPAKQTSRGIEGAPDLVAEILSPGTAQKDWTHKRWAYQAAGIPEYLIVDPDERVAALLRLEAGQYREVTHVAWGGVLGLLGGSITITLG